MWRLFIFSTLFIVLIGSANAVTDPVPAPTQPTSSAATTNTCDSNNVSLKSAQACAKDAANLAGYGTAQTDVATIAGEIVSVVLSLLGILFLILTIYGGFKWMIAGGNEEDVTKAKGIITNSIIGLAIVLGAFAIYTLVFQVLSGE